MHDSGPCRVEAREGARLYLSRVPREEAPPKRDGYPARIDW